MIGICATAGLESHREAVTIRDIMATYTNLLNGLVDLGIHKMQDRLDVPQGSD